MYAGGPALDAVNRTATTLNPTTVTGLHITHTYPGWHLWKTYPPIIAGGFAYGIGHGPGHTGTYIRAFHVPGGALAWQRQICPPSGGDCHNGAPAVSNGVVFVGGSAMYAFNAVWTPVVDHDNRVYQFAQVTVSGNTLYALPIAACPNGLCLQCGDWSYRLVGTAGLLPQRPPSLSPVVSHTSASVPDRRYRVGVQRRHRRRLCSLPTGGSANTVAVSNGIAYTLSDQNCVLRLQCNGGALLWSSPTGTPYWLLRTLCRNRHLSYNGG